MFFELNIVSDIIMFITGRHVLSSIIFVDKARILPHWSIFHVLPSKVGS